MSDGFGPAPYHDKHDAPDDLVWLDLLAYWGIIALVLVVVAAIVYVCIRWWSVRCAVLIILGAGGLFVLFMAFIYRMLSGK